MWEDRIISDRVSEASPAGCCLPWNACLLPLLELMGMSGRDVTEAIQWIKEKEDQVTSEDYGKDLVSSEALFHSHKTLERNLAVMNDKVSWWEEELTSLS